MKKNLTKNISNNSKSHLLFFVILSTFLFGTSQKVLSQETITVPNVFTPNNDGVNDEFKVNLNGTTPSSYHLSIFANWGILMFYTGNSNINWDGRTTSGLRATEGTYFYVLDLNGKEYKGTIMLLE